MPAAGGGGHSKRGRKLGYRSENTKEEGALCQVRAGGSSNVILCFILKFIMLPALTFTQVCGAKAGRHSYYGGDVCTSCRAFFRRWVILHTTGCLYKLSPINLV